MIKKYRKKPVVIEAMQYLREKNIGKVMDWFAENDSSRELKFDPVANEYVIKTLEGEHLLTYGDFIIKGIAGEFYPCKPDIFHATYEEVKE